MIPDIGLFLSFLLISVTLICIPGPNVLVIVATSMSRGKKHGLMTVCGTSFAMIMQLLIAALATTWLVNSLTQGFIILKICGVIYLVALGILQWRKAYKPETADIAPASFALGFFVSLTNPKTILFFSAFLPQFIHPHYDYGQQMLVLSASFWMLAVVLDSSYALLASRLSRYLQSRHKGKHLLTGTCYFITAGWLALLRR